MQTTLAVRKIKGMPQKAEINTFYIVIFSSEEESFGKIGGFVFLMPREVLSGKNVNACVTLHNTRRLPTMVMVDMEILGEHYTTNETVKSGRY